MSSFLPLTPILILSLVILFLVMANRPHYRPPSESDLFHDGTAAAKKEAGYYAPGNNQVIGFDGCSTLLVRAESHWCITGNDIYELPASIEQVNRGLYKVGFHTYWRENRMVHGKFYKASGHIMPRRKTDALSDLMLGYEHTYARIVVLERIPPHRLDVSPYIERK